MNTELETCGYCGGTGKTYGRMYDNEGRRRYTAPPERVCEYCDGAGACEHGNKLLPCESRESIIRRQS